MSDPIITLEQLKRKTGWKQITLQAEKYEASGVKYTTHRFSLLPSHATWPTIDLYFDEHFHCFDPLGFSNWHAHYDRWTDPRRNLVEALRTIRELVSQRLGLVEQLDASGKYWGGSLETPTAIPDTLGKDIRKLRRVHFDQPPKSEEVDLSRYWKGKTLLVEWEYKKETERLLREYNMPISW